jgi:branched-subunit amino acid aminotransferase/4-amino-4-deoxychorismate lyase
MVETRTFRWSDGALMDDTASRPETSTVRVADSWLTADGSAVAIDRHFDRFMASVHACDSRVDVGAFTEAVRGALPDSGRWFPRIEAIGDAGELTLRLLVRVAPEPSTEVTLATASHDPRSEPFVKGPDLSALGALRTELGAGEAIIVDNGFVAEGAWSSIVWWLNDTLHCVDPSIARLPGVTEQVIRDFARQLGSTVVPSRVRPEELNGAEVWVLSALHGIRVATEWRDGPTLHIEPGRAEFWRIGYSKNRKVILEA